MGLYYDSIGALIRGEALIRGFTVCENTISGLASSISLTLESWLFLAAFTRLRLPPCPLACRISRSLKRPNKPVGKTANS